MEKIRTWRTARDLSIDEAGSMVGVSGVQWHRYESGKRRVPAEKVQLISKITGIPPHELRPDVFRHAETAA
jgi:transcriptional regulator with XRE-family HTH domain